MFNPPVEKGQTTGLTSQLGKFLLSIRPDLVKVYFDNLPGRRSLFLGGGLVKDALE